MFSEMLSVSVLYLVFIFNETDKIDIWIVLFE